MEYEYKMKKYWLPLIDRAGSFPVRSKYTVPSIASANAPKQKQWLTASFSFGGFMQSAGSAWSFDGACVGCTGSGVLLFFFGFVDLMPNLVFFHMALCCCWSWCWCKVFVDALFCEMWKSSQLVVVDGFK